MYGSVVSKMQKCFIVQMYKSGESVVFFLFFGSFYTLGLSADFMQIIIAHFRCCSSNIEKCHSSKGNRSKNIVFSVLSLSTLQ